MICPDCGEALDAGDVRLSAFLEGRCGVSLEEAARRVGAAIGQDPERLLALTLLDELGLLRGSAGRTIRFERAIRKRRARRN